MQISETVRGTAPQALVPVFCGSAQGNILMVHSQAIYLTLNGAVYLCSPERFGVTPIGISTLDFDRMAALLRPMTGQCVELRQGRLCVCGAEFALSLSGYRQAPLYCEPDAEKCREAAKRLAVCGKEKGLALLAGALLLGQPPLGGELHMRSFFALQVLLEGMLRQKQEKIAAGAQRLLGLGVGLTPSGDDVLSGLIYGLQRSALHRSPALWQLMDTVREQAPQRTNRVSSAILQAICDGLPFERMQQAFCGLDRRFPAAEEPLLEIGSNSGSEMLLGLLLAADCVRKLRQEQKNCLERK